MYNIIYLNDHINYYESKNNKIIKHKPLNDTLKNGLIIDIKKFIKSFKKLLTENNIKPGLFYDKLIIITPPNFSSAYGLVNASPTSVIANIFFDFALIIANKNNSALCASSCILQ